MSKTKEIIISNSRCRVDPSTSVLVKITVESPIIPDLLSQINQEDIIEHLDSEYNVSSDPQERAEYMCAKLTGKTLSDCSMEQAKLFHEISRDPKLFITSK